MNFVYVTEGCTHTRGYDLVTLQTEDTTPVEASRTHGAHRLPTFTPASYSKTVTSPIYRLINTIKNFRCPHDSVLKLYKMEIGLSLFGITYKFLR